MFFSISLYLALVIFSVGLIYKVFAWFRYRVGDATEAGSAGKRLAAAVGGILATVFSVKLFSLIKITILDVLFQWKSKESPYRWFAHLCIFWGFMLLLLMHALDKYVTSALFTEYYSTINPFMFLRNLFGVMVIVGVVLAALRRLTVKKVRLTTRAMDTYSIVILAVIMISGFLLEASKIVSYSRFDDMVSEYASISDDEELTALKTYWQKEFGVVFPDLKTTDDPAVLEAGKSSHEISCVSCHSKPQSAFLSYATAKVITPVAVGLTKAGAEKGLWYIHFLACFIGLAYLPFSKFFHIFATPVSLLVNGVMEKERAAPANIATRRAMELDACTHCATCSVKCSVGATFRLIPNLNILPSEKLGALKVLAKNGDLSPQALSSIQEGCSICTSCYRCTKVCPSGINLQDLWFAMKEDLARRGYPDLFVQVQKAITAECAAQAKPSEEVLTLSAPEVPAESTPADPAGRFSTCFECQTCTNVCPVVSNFEDPKEALGLLPHQIMHALGLGLGNMALGAGMVWNCLTCYNCQEKCPQGVHVTDILYELKNEGFRHYKEKTASS